MRCKDGDLAVIVQDFEGCEGNLGVIVQVVGPARYPRGTTLICWQIKPVKRRKLWLTGSGPTAKEYITKKNTALHPDAWLMPIKGTPAGVPNRAAIGHSASSTQAPALAGMEG